jgi:cysteinyl-tRNA synthetase, unknown class
MTAAITRTAFTRAAVTCTAGIMLALLLSACAQLETLLQPGTAPKTSSPTTENGVGLPAPATPSTTRAAWNNIGTWGIQNTGFKRGVGLSEIQASGPQLVVIGQNAWGGQPWTRSEIDAARGKRWILAYHSVGAIGTYSKHWRSDWRAGNPGWLLGENSGWAGSWNVAYWDPAWQQLILDDLDVLINTGFDGIWVDQLDSYYNPGFPGGPSQENVARAVNWVCKISAHAKARKPDFKIMVNNGTEHVDSRKYPKSLTDQYLGCIDAMTQEHLWYGQDDVPADTGYQNYLRPLLNTYPANNKKVFTLDYTAQPYRKNQVIDAARALGWVPYVGLRNLDATPTICESEAKSNLGAACSGR